MTFNEIDIGNVRGIQGEKGDKGDKGNTPSLTDLKYDKQNGEFVTKKGNGNIVRYTITINGEEIECYMDKEGHLCNSEGYLIIDGELTEQQGVPFDIEEYGYEYLPLKIDEDNNLLNNNGEMIDDKGNVLYVESSFIGDIANYIYHDTDGYNQLIQSVYPYIVDTLVSADPTDEKYKNFFKEIEGDIKYYICADNPKLTIYMEDNDLHNTCKYKDGNGELVVDEDTGEYAFVPLEKNALYLYNAHSDAVDNEIMHYDIYLCTFANTVPKKLISANDFNIDYNVIDDFLLDVKDSVTDDEKEVYLKLFTRGTRGQFYSMSDVDTLFDDNVISKLGAVNGIAQLNNDGKVPLSQLPTVIENIIEGTMDNNGVFTPSDNSESDLVERESYVYLDINDGNSYRWSGSTYVYIGNTNDLDRQIDSELDEDSVHAVENGVITSKFNEVISNQNTVNISLNHSLSDVSDELELKEDLSNKVTSLDDSNTHYPTCEAVRLELGKKADLVYASDMKNMFAPVCKALLNRTGIEYASWHVEVTKLSQKSDDYSLLDITVDFIGHTWGMARHRYSNTPEGTWVKEDSIDGSSYSTTVMVYRPYPITILIETDFGSFIKNYDYTGAEEVG